MSDKAVEENESEEPKSDKEKTEEVSSRDDKDPSQNDKPCSVVNFLGQDVEAMITKLFNSVKQQYVCTDCKIICNKLSVSYNKIMNDLSKCAISKQLISHFKRALSQLCALSKGN